MRIRKRIYRSFPKYADLERKYRVRFPLSRFLKALRSMDGSSSEIHFNHHGRDVKAKREILVEIADKVEFVPLVDEIGDEKTVDFRINLRYSYLDERYNPIPLKGDTYLLRTNLERGILTLQLVHTDGPLYTGKEEVISIIKNAIER
jgi:hypothetical protein